MRGPECERRSRPICKNAKPLAGGIKGDNAIVGFDFGAAD
jgi:hypothetical protein